MWRGTRRNFLRMIPAPAMGAMATARFSAARGAHPLDLPGLVCFWDFQGKGGRARRAKGKHRYELQEMAGAVERVEGGVFGRYAARLNFRQWFRIPRAECPALDIHGPDAEVSVVAWIRRAAKRTRQRECEAVAGLWNETDALRQYCLFLNLKIFNSSDQVCGHVSSVGGPTPGHRWCMDASIGATAVPFDTWSCAGFTYDARHARSYLNGKLDARPERNPYPYQGGIFNAGAHGSDFTVGAVTRSGEMGNWFEGMLGGLAVFRRALTSDEMATLARMLPEQG